MRHFTRVSLALLAGLFFTIQLAAQPADPPVLARIDPRLPEAPQLPPALLVRPDNDKTSKPLALSRVKVDVLIAGHTAQTTLTMTFRNDLDRVLEGNLVFPLPEGSTIGGYALDIDGQLVEASVVESRQARYIFESEQRKGIDPGLIEWVKGNNFQTRVWPIPAKGTRTVRVMYLSELTADVQLLPPRLRGGPGDAGPDGGAAEGRAAGNEIRRALYALPLKSYGEVEELTVSVRVLGGAGVAIWGGGDWLKGQQQEADWVIAGELKRGAPKEDAVIAVPEAAQNVHIGTGPKGKDTYFVIRDTPKQPAVRWEPPRKGRVVVYWDASHSRSARPDTRDLDALKAALETLADGTVDVVAFRDRMDAPASFAWDSKDAANSIDRIARHLKQIPYDGGTNLGGLRIVKHYQTLIGKPIEENVPYAAALLFTDGLDTIGAAMPGTIDMPVRVFAADAKSNHPLLRLIAAKSGGQYFNLASVKPEDVARDLSHPPFAFIRAEFDPKHIADVYPNASQPVRAGGRFTFAGKLLVPETTVTLHYGFGDQHPVSTKITLKQADAVKDANAGGAFVARLWAQMKVDSLVAMPEENREQLIATGKQFGLVTPGTSLLVLETIEQYLEHGIEPPASREKIHKEWMAQIEQRQVAQKKTHEQKMQQVLAMWKEHVAWWEKEYKFPANLAKGDKKLPETLRRMRDLRVQIQDARGDDRARLQRDLDALKAQVARAEDAEDSRVVLRSVAPASPAPRTADGPAPARPPISEPRPGTPAPADPAAPRDSPRRFDSSGGGGGGDDGTVRSKKNGGEHKPTAAAIALKEWDPKTPYIKAMKDAGPQNAYAVYLDSRNQYSASPAFFFDCADYFFKLKQNDLAVRVLTSVLEMKLEDPRLMRVVAYQLQQHGHLNLAIDLFGKVAKLRPEEPQSKRDLALALGQRGDLYRLGSEKGRDSGIDGEPTAPDHEKAHADYSRAVLLLNDIVIGTWDGRFPGIEVIANAEANRILAFMKSLDLKWNWDNPLDHRLRQNLDADVRIVLSWDTDQTDIDLWVVEPSGERSFYSHPLTTIGGLMSKDFTGGYGPEVYGVRKAMHGGYSVLANFYGSRAQTLTGGTTILATIYTNYARPNEERQTLTVRLTESKEIVELGAIVFGEPDATK